MKTLQDYRHLTATEEEVLSVLLKKNFPGVNELIEQLKTALVKAIDENSSLSFLIDSTTLAPIKRGIPTEARTKDEDGIFINVLLHVVDGKLRELEIYKDDGSPMRKKIDPTQLEVFDHYLEYSECHLNTHKNRPN